MEEDRGSARAGRPIEPPLHKSRPSRRHSLGDTRRARRRRDGSAPRSARPAEDHGDVITGRAGLPDERVPSGNDRRAGLTPRLSTRVIYETFRADRNCTSVAARMIRKSTKEIAAAYPMFHQRKPCLYMRSPVESVAFKGPPPPVMT